MKNIWKSFKYGFSRFHDIKYYQAEVVPPYDKVYHRGSYTPFLMLHYDERLTRIEPQPIYIQQDPTGDYYDMTASKHGLALIFNNETFEDHAQRVGTARDEENVRRTCYYLGYCPIVFRQFTKDKVEELFKSLDSFIGNFDDEVANDSLLCFFLTHGSEGIIFASDSEGIPIADIEEWVSDCGKLNSKPKIFFIQACQQKAKINPMPPEQDGDGDNHHACKSDIYKSFASVSGANRDHVRGSWFMSEFCYTLCNLATCNTFDILQTKLNRRISYDNSAIPDISYCNEFEGKKSFQLSYGDTRLSKQFHFFYKSHVT